MIDRLIGSRIYIGDVFFLKNFSTKKESYFDREYKVIKIVYDEKGNLIVSLEYIDDNNLVKYMSNCSYLYLKTCFKEKI